MPSFHAAELDRFVAAVDHAGGLAAPAAAPLLTDFEVRFDAAVDPALDPFSDGYFRQQVALYAELSGRPLDQESGELTPFDVAAHAAAANPYNSADVRFLAKHNRAVLTCLMIADLDPGAAVLDAGSGWGLSSEALARCGTAVTAVDINPLFADLVRRRAARLGLPIDAVRAGFDTFATDKRFDLLLFYECLHHSLKPWDTLGRLGRFVKPDGKVIFAGEPVQGHWWPHWGLRLDPESVYCVRKFGWWESGWTAAFIAACFARAGFELAVYDHVGLDNGLVGVAVRPDADPPARVDLSALASARHVAELARCRQELAEARNELACVRASRSWRLTAPVRAACQALGVGRG